MNTDETDDLVERAHALDAKVEEINPDFKTMVTYGHLNRRLLIAIVIVASILIALGLIRFSRQQDELDSLHSVDDERAAIIATLIDNNQTLVDQLEQLNITPKAPTPTPEALAAAAGERGPTGETGPRGDPGPRGLQGEQGPIGDTGNQGVSGPPGINGDTGLPGPKGVDGASGSNGVNGANGIDGAPGIQGPAGANGIDGAPGVNGVNGINGAPGVNGIDGAPGVNGADGAPGAPGVQGIPGTIEGIIQTFTDPTTGIVFQCTVAAGRCDFQPLP